MIKRMILCLMFLGISVALWCLMGAGTPSLPWLLGCGLAASSLLGLALGCLLGAGKTPARTLLAVLSVANLLAGLAFSALVIYKAMTPGPDRFELLRQRGFVYAWYVIGFLPAAWIVAEIALYCTPKGKMPGSSLAFRLFLHLLPMIVVLGTVLWLAAGLSHLG